MDIDESTIPAIISLRVTDPVEVIRALKSAEVSITEGNTLNALSRAFLRIPDNSALFRALKSTEAILSEAELCALTACVLRHAPGTIS